MVFHQMVYSIVKEALHILAPTLCFRNIKIWQNAFLQDFFFLVLVGGLPWGPKRLFFFGFGFFGYCFLCFGWGPSMGSYCFLFWLGVYHEALNLCFFVSFFGFVFLVLFFGYCFLCFGWVPTMES